MMGDEEIAAPASCKVQFSLAALREFFPNSGCDVEQAGHGGCRELDVICQDLEGTGNVPQVLGSVLGAVFHTRKTEMQCLDMVSSKTSSLPHNPGSCSSPSQPLLYFSIFGFWFFELTQTKPNVKDLNGSIPFKKFKAEMNSIHKELGWILKALFKGCQGRKLQSALLKWQPNLNKTGI